MKLACGGEPMSAEAGEEMAYAYGSPAAHTLGSYAITDVAFELTFPEPNATLMRHKQEVSLAIREPTRFIERRSRWTGRGIQNSPRITAIVDGDKLPARRHGPHYFEGSWRAYLVDLGKTLNPGDKLTLTTVVQYIDESGDFEPFFRYAAPTGLTSLSFAVKFKNAPAQCTYTYETPADSTPPIAAVDPQHMSPLEETTAEGDILTAYRHQQQNPPTGHYRYTWTINA